MAIHEIFCYEHLTCTPRTNSVLAQKKFWGHDNPANTETGLWASRQKSIASAGHREEINIEPVDIDRYDRTVGIVRADGAVINGEMVKNGYAWVPEQAQAAKG